MPLSEGSSSREKHANHVSNGKSRRIANGANVGSALQNMATANTGAANLSAGVSSSQDNVNSSNPDSNSRCSLTDHKKMEWPKIDPSILHEYRYAYRLNTPSAFSNPHNELVLSRGIGKMSPTMARRKDRRRQSKEQLTHAVRKHFNGIGIQENEVVVDFLYKIHHMGNSPLIQYRWYSLLIRSHQTRISVCDLHPRNLVRHAYWLVGCGD